MLSLFIGNMLFSLVVIGMAVHRYTTSNNNFSKLCYIFASQLAMIGFALSLGNVLRLL